MRDRLVGILLGVAVGSPWWRHYYTHADPQKPSGERVVNIDRLQFDEDETLKIKGPSRNHQPMPSGCQ